MRAFARSMRRGNSCQHCANYDDVSARAVKENTERPPALPEFLLRHPHITFDFFDLVGENVDVSLRIGPLKDSGLVACKIVDLTRIVCASPAHLARHGRPVEPADLVHHACLTLSRNPD
jgi:DNA-binding transcriptional LysR family regulator